MRSTALSRGKSQLCEKDDGYAKSLHHPRADACETGLSGHLTMRASKRSKVCPSSFDLLPYNPTSQRQRPGITGILTQNQRVPSEEIYLTLT
jgi:hypothetical protein